MNPAVEKSFELEQMILKTWNITDDIKMLSKQVIENDEVSLDDISNVLIGIEYLYNMRFDEMFRAFEEVHRELCIATRRLDNEKV